MAIPEKKLLDGFSRLTEANRAEVLDFISYLCAKQEREVGIYTPTDEEASRLRVAIAQLDMGKGKMHELIEAQGDE